MVPTSLPNSASPAMTSKMDQTSGALRFPIPKRRTALRLSRAKRIPIRGEVRFGLGPFNC